MLSTIRNLNYYSRIKSNKILKFWKQYFLTNFHNSFQNIQPNNYFYKSNLKTNKLTITKFYKHVFKQNLTHHPLKKHHPNKKPYSTP